MSPRPGTTEPAPSPYPWGDARKPRRDDVFELELERLEEGGEVSGTADGYRVRVRGAPPGSRVRARARKRRKDRVDADVLEVLEPARDAAAPRCPHFGTCGGCSFQFLDDRAQLAGLGELARRQLAPLADACGGEDALDGLLAPVLGAERPWHYRNKMDFTFSSRRWVDADEADGVRADFALGMHVRGRHDKVLELRACDIAFEGCEALRSEASALARELELAPWDNREHRGVLRHLVLRHSLATGEVLVYLVTGDEERERVRAYAAELVRRRPEIDTLVHGVRTAVSSVAVGEAEEVLHGPGVIHDELAGVRLRISPTSFFQTNSAQAQVLARVVTEETATRADDVLFDVYCGGGAWGLVLAGGVRRVVGFELAASSVADARHNARAAGIENATFVAGDVAATLAPESLAELDTPRPRVVVVDPPRAGLHPRVVAALRELAPERLVYVSCHLPSAVRDVAALQEGGLRLARVRPVDLFPHTPHLECVLTLERAATA